MGHPELMGEEIVIHRNNDNWNSKCDSQMRGTNRRPLIMGARWLVSIVLVAGVAFAMCGCGARSSLPVPPLDPNAIAYTSNRALDGSDNGGTPKNIWVINPNGTGSQPLTQLTASEADSIEPVWSPNGGTQIAFASFRAVDGSDEPNGAGNIWVSNLQADGTINANSSGSQPLTQFTLDGVSRTQPTWSPDGTQIAFRSDMDPHGTGLSTNDTVNIWVVSADGTKVQALTKLTALGADSIEPAWSPKGTQIAFASRRAFDPLKDQANTNNTLNIWVMNADGSQPKALTQFIPTDMDAPSFDPVWSPKGTEIAFASAIPVAGGNKANPVSNIWVVNPDGSNLKSLTNSIVANSRDPVWSPDGTQIAFASNLAFDASTAANPTNNIWVMNADGSKAHALTQLRAAENHEPVWSPNGAIAFLSNRALDGSDEPITGVFNIWVINADGSGHPSHLTQLTHASCFTLSQRGALPAPFFF